MASLWQMHDTKICIMNASKQHYVNLNSNVYSKTAAVHVPIKHQRFYSRFAKGNRTVKSLPYRNGCEQNNLKQPAGDHALQERKHIPSDLCALSERIVL